MTSNERYDSRRRPAIAMRWEVKIATGREGELLGREQAAAIRRVLAWVASTRSSQEQADGAAGSH